MKVFLLGFVQQLQTRLFTFKCVADDRSTTQVAIGVDMSLARKYSIPLQDLPAICKRLAETSAANEPAHSDSVSEAEMSAIRSATLAALPKKGRGAPARFQYLRQGATAAASNIPANGPVKTSEIAAAPQAVFMPYQELA